MDLKEIKEITNSEDLKIIVTKLSTVLGIECTGKVRIYGTLDAPLYVASDISKLFDINLQIYGIKSKYIDKIHKYTINDGHKLIVLTNVGLALTVVTIRTFKLQKIRCVTCFQTANPDYENYCKWCYRKSHPENTNSVTFMKKENSVAKFLADKIDHKFGCNQSIGTGISKYRPDVYFDCKEYGIVVEIDEKQHKKYKDEAKRMNILQAEVDKPVHFIRFNPDGYFACTDYVVSCWRDDKVTDGTAWNARLAKLIELLEKIFKNPEMGDEKMRVYWLYYNS